MSQKLEPMEARSVGDIPTGDEWQYEPKWDGFRCLLARDGKSVTLTSKSGEDLTRYFPEVADAAALLPERRFLLDGELVVPLEGVFSFDTLLQRIHLHHVGFTSALTAQVKPGLTDRLESLVTSKSFTGNTPGGPSRWSTKRSSEWTPIKPKLVVEVSYDHYTGGRFRHGTTVLRWRPEKKPRRPRAGPAQVGTLSGGASSASLAAASLTAAHLAAALDGGTSG